jgi:hypothetical protein
MNKLRRLSVLQAFNTRTRPNLIFKILAFSHPVLPRIGPDVSAERGPSVPPKPGALMRKFSGPAAVLPGRGTI